VRLALWIGWNKNIPPLVSKCTISEIRPPYSRRWISVIIYPFQQPINFFCQAAKGDKAAGQFCNINEYFQHLAVIDIGCLPVIQWFY